jgi:hypothetical protein
VYFDVSEEYIASILRLGLTPASAGVLLGLLFDPEDGHDVPPNYDGATSYKTS